MKRNPRRWVLPVALMAAVAWAAWRASRPEPLTVETGTVTSGPMSLFIEEQGETRAHDRFVITAPVAGQVSRIELREGDAVRTSQVVASIRPRPLDPRSALEASARVRTAESLHRQALERIAQVETTQQQQERDRDRTESLWRSGDVSQQAAEQSRSSVESLKRELAAARHAADAARHDVEVARSALIAVESAPAGQSKITEVRSPVAGRVLIVNEKSERAVDPGTPLLTIGGVKNLEIVVDVLSSDAVRIQPGAAVELVNWGGDCVIRAKVRNVEPLAFTKTSALGVEEKRVHVIADFVDAPGPLGDGYRVDARIILWAAANVLKVPASAVFRHGPGWAVFTIREGRFAALSPIQAGHRNAEDVEVRGGLAAGETVIVHPPRDLAAGSLVAPSRH